ncbi:hypothetical protein [Streptomyces sp. R02]|uniref:Gcp-like domain-containing protein n=1 Tax=Streptomyces sp. R02 TaxID=3238623 RepID=A0AB39LTR5_9ACTN
MGSPIVLGIESSCDETGAGLVRDGRLLGHAVASSMDEHARFGGVVLTRKAVAACTEHGVGTLVVVGGVAANSRVRSLAGERCRAAGIALRVPPLRLCTDNGAMIAAVGDILVRAGAEPAPLDVSIDPSAPLEYAALHPVAAGAVAA